MDSSSSDPKPSSMTVINPSDLGAPKGFSHGILTPPGAALLFVAGQVGWDKDERVVSDSFAAQFQQALRNVVHVVSGAGGSIDQIARLTIYVTDKNEYLSDLSSVGQAYRDVMGKHFPAMALLEVKALVEPEAKVEIEATAAII